MLLKRVLKRKTSFICYFEFHKLYLFTFSRLKSLPCPSSTLFAGQLARVIDLLECYNAYDDYQCYFINFINVKDKKSKCGVYFTHFTTHPRFALSSAFYPHIHVLPSHPCFTLISMFYPLRPSVRIRLLPLPPVVFCITV